MLHILLFSAALFTASSTAQSSTHKPIVATYGQDYIPPYIVKDSSQNVIGGLMHDLYKLLEKQTKTEFKLVPAPKNRESTLMLEGKADLTCYNSKLWTGNPNMYLWSKESLFSVDNIIVYNPNRFKHPPKNINDLVGKSVGTILGYRHEKSIEDKFKTGEIKKVAARNFVTLYRSLSEGRIDSIIDTDIQFHYEKHKNKTKNIEAAKLLLNSYDIFCQVSPKSGHLLDRLNRAISSLKKNGQMNKLLKKYK